MPHERLIQRVLGQQAAKLTNQVGVPAKLQFAFDALANCGAAFLFEAAAHPGHPVAVDPGQRLATPQPVRLAQKLSRVIMIAGRNQGSRLSPQPTELMQVDRLGIDIEHIAAGTTR
jgi:hypothetical protein